MYMQKRIFSIAIILLIVILCASICINRAVAVQLDSEYETSINNIFINPDTNQIVVQWEQNNRCDGYQIQYGTLSSDDSQNIITINNGQQNSTKLDIHDFVPGQQYFFSIRTYVNTDMGDATQSKSYSNWSSNTLWSWPWPLVCIEQIDLRTNQVKIKLDYTKSSPCDGFELKIISTPSNTKSVLVQLTNTDEIVLNNMTFKEGMPYRFKIRAYHVSDGKMYYSNVLADTVAKTTFEAPTGLETTVNDDFVYFSWEFDQELTYTMMIECQDTDESLTYKIDNVEQMPYVIPNNLKHGATYTVRLQAYNANSDKFSDWTNSVRFSYQKSAPRLTMLSAQENSIIVGWADNDYEECNIQYSTSTDFSYSEIFVVKNNLGVYSIDNIAPGDYYVRLRGGQEQDCLFHSNCYNCSEWGTPYPIRISASNTDFVRLSVTDQSITFRLIENSDVDGYEVIYSTSPLGDTDSLSFRIAASDFTDIFTIENNLIPGVTTYFKVRTYSTHNGMQYFSAWSKNHLVTYKISKTYLKHVTDENKDIVFDWKTIDGVNYELAYDYTDANGNISSHIVTIYDSEVDRYVIQNAAPGKYSAKIITYRLVDDTKYYSEWSNVKTINYTMPKTYLTSQYASNNEMVVKWKPVAGCDGYQLRWSTKEDFSDGPMQLVLGADSNTYRTSKSIPGTHYFKIRTYKIDSNDTPCYSEWSNVKTCNYFYVKPYFTNQVSENNLIKITWLDVNSNSYEIQYSKNEDFSNDQKAILTSGQKADGKITNYITNENLIPGQYFIRIRAIHKLEGTKTQYYSDWSNTKTVEYKLSKTYIKNLVSTEGRIDVTWKQLENCSGYQIQYSEKSNMSNPIVIEIPDCEFDFCAIGDNVKPGTYYVRIRTVHAVDGRTYYSDWSNIKSAKLGTVKTYLTSQYALSDQIVLKWKIVPSCDGYQIQYSKDSTFSNSVGSKELLSPNTETLLLSDLDAGTYYFRIRTLKYSGSGDTYYASDWSNAKSVTYYPKTVVTITSISSNMNKVVVRWNSLSSVAGYELQYGLDPDFVADTKTETIEFNKTESCELNVLPGHNYFRIRTYKFTLSGSKVYSDWSPVKTHNFQINAVNFTNISIADGTSNLTWSISKGSHGYQIQYSTDSNFETDVQTKQIVNTNTLNTHITNLQPDTYYIRIRAYKNIDSVKYYSEWSIIETITVQ